MSACVCTVVVAVPVLLAGGGSVGGVAPPPLFVVVSPLVGFLFALAPTVQIALSPAPGGARGGVLGHGNVGLRLYGCRRRPRVIGGGRIGGGRRRHRIIGDRRAVGRVAVDLDDHREDSAFARHGRGFREDHVAG